MPYFVPRSDGAGPCPNRSDHYIFHSHLLDILTLRRPSSDEVNRVSLPMSRSCIGIIRADVAAVTASVKELLVHVGPRARSYKRIVNADILSPIITEIFSRNGLRGKWLTSDCSPGRGHGVAELYCQRHNTSRIQATDHQVSESSSFHISWFGEREREHSITTITCHVSQTPFSATFKRTPSQVNPIMSCLVDFSKIQTLRPGIVRLG